MHKSMLQNKHIVSKVDFSPLFDKIEKITNSKLAKEFIPIIKALPEVESSYIKSNKEITIEGKDLSKEDSDRVESLLTQLVPWRKGPISLLGNFIDTEWQSYKKWDRIKNHLSSMEGQKILDIGSNNGYYLYKIAEQNPGLLIGTEPYLRYYYQYLAIAKYYTPKNTYLFPVRHEDMPELKGFYNKIFCMGILYHRRSPIDFLQSLRQSLVNGGELICETITIPGEEDICLAPYPRYAKMRNVYFLPTLPTLRNWLSKAGFKNIEHIDSTETTIEEQRQTKWVQAESLSDFLSTDDPRKTIEGYPLPIRSILICS